MARVVRDQGNFHYLSVIIFCAIHCFLYSICDLYKWRYNNLGDLSHIRNWPEYQMANAGFNFDFQLINVEDFNSIGETEPSPYFYQVNLTL